MSWLQSHMRVLFTLFIAFVAMLALTIGLGVGLGIHNRDHEELTTPTTVAIGVSSSSSSLTSAISSTSTAGSTTVQSSQILTSRSATSSAETTVPNPSSIGTTVTTVVSSVTPVNNGASSTTSISDVLPTSTTVSTALGSSFISSFTISSTSSPTSSYSATTPLNPVATVGPPQFLGNVTSNNTFDIRDCGWQGNIGSTWINTFGDTIPCTKAWQEGCFGLEAPSSAGIPISPTKYFDFDTRDNGKYATYFCPLMDGEQASFGLGITNVVQVTETEGVAYFLRNNRSVTPAYIDGSGVVSISVSGPKPVCTRTSLYWWGITEPFWGDHGVVLGTDGYIYIYGGKGNIQGGSGLFLMRVQQATAFDLSAYEYWNGTAYTPERLYNPTVEQTVLTAGQGSIIFSPLYQMYIYFKPGCYGWCIMAQAADRPEGPWSTEYRVFNSAEGPNNYQFYSPAVQPKWSDPEMRNLVIIYTGRGKGFGNILQAINVTFT